MRTLIFLLLTFVSMTTTAQMKVPVGYRKIQSNMTEATYRNANGIMFTFRAMGQEIEDGLDSSETQRMVLDEIFGTVPCLHNGYMNYEKVPMYDRNINRYIYHIYKDYSLYMIVVSSPRNDKEFTSMFQNMVISLENAKEYYFQ